MNKRRLLAVARDLRNSPNPRKFTMHCFVNLCGSPACAIGHYAAANHRGAPFRISDSVLLATGPKPYHVSEAAQAWFDLTPDQYIELFGGDGCGGATTAKQAAKYIERFVATGGRP